MSEAEAVRRTGGRSARVRKAVLEATLQAVAENGAEAVNIRDIAREAGVHDTSVYRRWGTRERLVLDALLAHSQEQLPVPDTGSLRGDLTAFARSLAAYLADPLGRDLARAMAFVSDDPTQADGRAEFWRSRQELTRVMVERAARRGELAEDTDPAMVTELLVAPLHFRALLTRQPVDDRYLDQLVDRLLRGIAR